MVKPGETVYTGVLYTERTESITTRDALDRALVAEERASRLMLDYARLLERYKTMRAIARAAVVLLLRDEARGRMP